MAVAPAALIAGGIVAVFVMRRRRASAASKPLDEAEKRRLATILDSEREP